MLQQWKQPAHTAQQSAGSIPELSEARQLQCGQQAKVVGMVQ